MAMSCPISFVEVARRRRPDDLVGLVSRWRAHDPSLDEDLLDMAIEAAATKLGDPPIDLGLRMTDDTL